MAAKHILVRLKDAVKQKDRHNFACLSVLLSNNICTEKFSDVFQPNSTPCTPYTPDYDCFMGHVVAAVRCVTASVDESSRS